MNEDTEKETGVYDHWMKELLSEAKAHDPWRKRAGKVMKRYADEEKGNDSRFNILWSNTEVLHSAVYGKTPIPDVRRRFHDKDPVAREISEVMERGLSYNLDVYNFDSMADSVVDDYLLAGLGNARIRYQPYFEKGEPPVIPLRVEETPGMYEDFPPERRYFNGEKEIERNQMIMGAEGPFMYGEPEEELIYEEVTCESVPWNRFRWQPAKRWEDVNWACIEHYLTRRELQDQFPKHANQIPLGYSETGEKLSVEEDGKSRALVHEIFCKRDRKVIVLAEGCKEVLDEEEDPLELEGFYPFPAPLVSTTLSDKFIPIPDYIYYQDQAMELDTLTQRIDKLTNELKYRGVYDGSFESLQNMTSADDAQFIAVDDFAERFDGKGNLDSVIKTMPLEELQRVIVALYQAREQVKQTIYEITGIADIMRGSTKSSETLGAQQLKTQFGSMRLSKRQRKVECWLRDIMRLKAEVIVEHFDPDTLSEMVSREITPEMHQIMQSDLLRSFKVDIETDSTVTEDAAQERQDRIELLSSITAFAEQVGPAVVQGLVPIEVARELLLFGVRGFKVGRTLEDTLESLGGEQDENNGPNPEMMQMQQQMQQMQQQAQEAINQLQQQIGDLQQQLEAAQAQAQDKSESLALEADKANVARQHKDRELDLAEMKLRLEHGGELRMAEGEAADKLLPLLLQMQQIMEQMTAPKRLVRDEEGNAIGVETILN